MPTFTPNSRSSASWWTDELAALVSIDSVAERHYLRDELEARASSTAELFNFLHTGSLDGLWYWTSSIQSTNG